MPQNTTSTPQSVASWPILACLMALILFSSLPSTILFAQTPTPIHMRRELINYKPQHFYVAKVTDGRAKKDNIGTVFNGIANRPNTADLHGGVEKTLHENLRWTLPRDSSKVPVEMEIRHLMIRETLETFSEFAELELMVVFYDLSNERKQLYMTRLKIDERLAVDVTASHERRIRSGMVQAIKELDAAGLWNGQSAAANLTEGVSNSVPDSSSAVVMKTATTDSLLAANTAFSITDAPNAAAPNDGNLGLGFMLLGGRQLAVNSTGWYGTAYLFFNQNPNNLQVPFSIGFEQISISEEAVLTNGWAPVELSYRLPGLAAFQRIEDLLHLGLFVHVPFGTESAVNLRTLQAVQRNFVGISGGVGLYLMDNESASLVAGVRLHMMSTNSLAYPRDVGVRLEAGFRF